MAKSDMNTVSAYIAAQPAPARKALTAVRQAIQGAVPDAQEVISYQIPAYRLPDGIVIYFAGWKHHYSIYPATRPLIEAFKDDLEPYEVNDKGTIRFPLDAPVPTKLIARIAKFRAKETKERRKRKTSRSPTRARTRGRRR
jgi:uncharacterized protein YdhG (YjbR/CyaY superfamily)